MPRSARLIAQCKVNLFLHVLARESSGYHQLETLFCRLALGDVVTVRLGAAGGGRSIDCAGERLPAGGLGAAEQNLAWRAATAFAESTGLREGWAIEIDKRIPVGGGLGGGSADAGAVLRLLNALVDSPLPESELLRLGGALGADVPFLTQSRGALALGWGRGDRLLALPPLPSRACRLVCFPFGVPTADAYRWLAESPASPMPPVTYSREALTSWATVDALARNEFERVVSPRYPAIAGVIAAEGIPRLPGHAVVRLSGSGSTVFVLAPSHDPDGRAVAWEEVVARHASRWGAEIVVTETAFAVEQVDMLE